MESGARMTVRACEVWGRKADWIGGEGEPDCGSEFLGSFCLDRGNFCARNSV
jgi:hypothetical protein